MIFDAPPDKEYVNHFSRVNLYDTYSFKRNKSTSRIRWATSLKLASLAFLRVLKRTYERDRLVASLIFNKFLSFDRDEVYTTTYGSKPVVGHVTYFDCSMDWCIQVHSYTVRSRGHILYPY